MHFLPLSSFDVRLVNPSDTQKPLAAPCPVQTPFSAPQCFVEAGVFPDPRDRAPGAVLDLLPDAVFEAVCTDVLTLPENATAAALRLTALDARAEVYLDDELLFSTCDQPNAFRTYTLPLPGNVNGRRLKIRFLPVRTWTAQRHAADPTPMDENGFSYTAGYVYPFIRKAAYNGGWDWCYPLPNSCGVARVELLASTSDDPFALEIQNVFYRYTLDDEATQAIITPELTLHVEHSGTHLVTIAVDNMELYTGLLRVSPEQNLYTLPALRIVHPRLWQPNDLGQPALYTFKLTLSRSEEQRLEHEQRIGFRTVSLYDPDEPGRMRFKINGRFVFARGANLIPFAPGADMRRLLEQAVCAHFNMVRVWGGGTYGTDEFYALCDELGLMVWQDFPFACNLYPQDDAFAENVRQEAREHIMRMRSHPSLVLLCGNNEAHSCYYQWMSGRAIPTFFGGRFYDTILPECAAELAAHVPYIPGSPHNPLEPAKPGDAQHGDAHCWQCYFGSPEAENDFNVLSRETARFISETGFIGLPNEARSEAELADRCNYNIPLERVKRYSAQLMPEIDDFPRFLRAGNIAQGLMFERIIAAWRLRGLDGLLLWHYNDMWNAPSWGVIDGKGKPRVLYAVLKRLFAPVCLCFSDPDHAQVCADSPVPETASLRCVNQPERSLSWAVLENKGKVLASALYLHCPPKQMNFDAEERIEVSALTALDAKEGVYEYLLTPDDPLAYVHFSLGTLDDKAEFSEQDIHLLPQQVLRVRVKLSAPDAVPLQRLKTALRCMSLRTVCTGKWPKMRYARPQERA